ncbi:MAG: hypothetical protein IRZ28_11200 [Steroidobacteraceae bacterium]|nr:hypothetical protein [Steroidobacteraceae bacterium]
MAGPRFRVRGLKELDRALGRADKHLRKNLRALLRSVAEGVARDARSIAMSKGLRDSGDLIAGIKPYALTGRAGVRSNARHRGYGYPARLEFESRGGRSWGPRATLNPAVQRNKDEIERGIERVLDELGHDFAGGGLL